MDRFTACVPQAEVLKIDARLLVNADGVWPSETRPSDRESACEEPIRQREVRSIVPALEKDRIGVHARCNADGARDLKELIAESPALPESIGERGHRRGCTCYSSCADRRGSLG